MAKNKQDTEGRVITAEYDDFFLVNVYTPNSGEGLKRLGFRLHSWDASFGAYIKELEAKKPVVLTGDLNCCAEPIDIHNPEGNLKSAGTLPSAGLTCIENGGRRRMGSDASGRAARPTRALSERVFV